MQITASNINCLITAFDKLIQLDNNPFKSYGHIDESTLVYIQHGIYNEYKVVQDKNIFVFEYVCGDILFGYKILNNLKHIINNDLIPLERNQEVDYPSNMEELFLKYLFLLDDYIFKKNAIEYITQLSIKLFTYLLDDKFRELYIYEYEYIMYEKIEQYLRFNIDNDNKIISLFHLINVIFHYCPMPEYKDLISKYVDSEHKYIKLIAIDMLNQM
jgi:hypothetical protein